MTQIPRPSYAGVTATLALLIALSGTSYAAVTLARGSVGTAQLKNGAVTTPKLDNGAVTSKKLKSNAVTPGKMSDYTDSHVVKLDNGQKKVLLKKGPFVFTAKCSDAGGGASTAALRAKNTGIKAALFESNYESNYADPFLGPGESREAFYVTTDTSPYWFGEYYNMFSVTSDDGATSLVGQGNIGVKVLGADCAFQLYTFGS